MKKINIYFLTAISFTIITSCNNEKGKQGSESTGETEKTINVTVPKFNEDSAYAYVKKQVEFGPRVTNSGANKKCAEYLVSKLKKYTQYVIVQEAKVKAFDGTILNAKNIIASFNPDNNKRILLCAHWDSRPFADHDPDKSNYKKPIDGANDGASGVGVLLETARQLSLTKINTGIDIIFFDAEDYGEYESVQHPKDNTWALGTQYWAKNPHKLNYSARYGILLDMVGTSDATFTMEGTSMYYAPDVMRKVWNTAGKLGYSSYFIFNETNAITDDHLYINKFINIPTIDIIHIDSKSETGFFKYWHTTKDNIDCIDKNTLKVVGQTVLTVIYEEK